MSSKTYVISIVNPKLHTLVSTITLHYQNSAFLNQILTWISVSDKRGRFCNKPKSQLLILSHVFKQN